MDRMTTSSLAGPRACTTCAKAKAKCLPLPSLGVCERCRRLKKPCLPQTPAPPRKRARKHNQAIKKPSRVEALEGRIEELSSRLAAVAGNHMPVEPNSPEVPEIVDKSDVNVETHWESTASAADGAWLESEQTSIPPLLESIHPASQVPREPFPLNSAENLRQAHQSVMKAQKRKADSGNNSASTSGHDEETIMLLSRYRTHMQHRFPFVIVPPELANKEDRQRRPFLWRAVKVAALWQEHARHIKIGKRLLSDLTDAILLRPIQGFDVVQGLLIFIAWYHWNLDKFQLTNLLGLLQSLCLSLNFGQNTLTRSCGKDAAPILRDDALDQGRAYCGWYYLSTVVFTMSEKPEACPQTHFIDQLCDTLLSQDLRQPTDKWLVALVKVERLALSIEVMKASRKMGGHSAVPLNVIMSGFQQQISNLKKSFPADLVDDQFLQHHFLLTDMILHEAAVSDFSFHPFLCQNSTIGGGAMGNLSDTFDMQQTNIQDYIGILNACTVSVKAILANYLTHGDEYIKLSYVASFDMTYCLRLLGSLTELRIVGWETSTVNHRLGLDNELLKKHIDDLINLAAKTNTQSSRHDGDEDDVELSPVFPEIGADLAKHPFECIAEDLKSVLSLVRGEDGEGNESLAGSDVATPKAHCDHRDAGEHGRRDTSPLVTTTRDFEGQGTRTVESKVGTEAFWQTAASVSSPARESTEGERSAVPSTKDGSFSQMLAIPTEPPYFFPGGGFSQISFWPRLVRNEDEN